MRSETRGQGKTNGERRVEAQSPTAVRRKVSAEGREEVSISAANRAYTPWCAERSTFEGGGHLHLEVLRERCSVRGKFMNALFLASVSSIRTRPRLRLDFSLALHLLAFFVFVSFDSY